MKNESHDPPSLELLRLLGQAQRLEEQSQQDPRANILLLQICEQMWELLQLDWNPSLYATVQSLRGSAYSDLPTGDQVTHLRRAIACYQEVLRFRTPNTAPLGYAMVQSGIGDVYAKLPTEDREANLEKAIACYQEALRFLTLENAPLLYAAVQKNLGVAYCELFTEEQGAKLLQAVACYQEALRFWSLETAPLDYARVQSNLGNVYLKLPTGNRKADLKKAIAYYQEALRFLTPRATPLDYAMVQNNLGNAYSKQPEEEQETRQLQAVTCYREVLRIGTLEIAPLNYAGTQCNLGDTYLKMRTGDRAANLRQAIVAYQEALRVWTPETSPRNYAKLQQNLGNTYQQLCTEDRATNVWQAVSHYQEALRFLTPEVAPLDYSLIQDNLGAAYQQLPTGDQSANVERAITCYQEALRFRTPKTTPLDYAQIQISLGTALSNLPTKRNDRANQERVITCYEEALRFLTPETKPLVYAGAQMSLGNAYLESSTGDRDANWEKAIACYQEALRFWTPETAPLDYARAQVSLGTAYSRLSIGDQSAAITCYQEALRFWTPETAPLGYASIQDHQGVAYQRLVTKGETALAQQAIASFLEALRFYTPNTMPSDARQTNKNLADLHFFLKDWNAALDAYRAAIQADELIYRAGLSRDSKVVALGPYAQMYHQAAFSAVRCGETTEALLLLERGKTRILNETLHLRIPHPEHVPNDVWAEFTDAADAVHAILSNETIPSHESHGSVQISEAREQVVHATNDALNLAIEHVRIHAPDFLREIDLCTIRELLPTSRACLIAFCFTEQGSVGLLVTRHCQEIQVIEVPHFTRSDLVDLFIRADGDRSTSGFNGWISSSLRCYAERTPTAFSAWQKTMTDTLAALGHRLLDPLLSALPPNIEQLIFLPSEQLFLFPLHAVPLLGNPCERVCDRYQISYTPSLAVLANTRTKSTQVVPPQLYAVINPQADPQLVFTPREGASIANHFAQSEVDEGRIGTKQRVLARMRGQSYIHFSCHGSYNLFDPIESGLELAEDCLTLAELQQGGVDLSVARLVTLSACETGVVDVLGGRSEEYIGVPSGFLLAGVPCVISSLWAVPDLSTALLMERFYYNHLKSEMGFPAALREAQRWVRTLEIGKVAQYAEQCYDQSGRKNATLWRWCRHYRALAKQDPDLRPFAHPHYWAAFTVNGW